MPLSTTVLAGEIVNQVWLKLALNTEATDIIGWEEKFILHFKQNLEAQVGSDEWSAGDLENASTALATALGQTGTKHFLAIVAAIANAVVVHIQDNALVTVSTVGTSAAQTGTGTIA